MNNNNHAFAWVLFLGLLWGLATSSVVAGPKAVADTLEQAAPISSQVTRAPLNAATMAGERLLVAGLRGAILYSDDHGQSWTQASVPVSVSLTGLCFNDPSNGWAVGHRGVILASRDGGRSWTRQLHGLQAAQAILQVRRQPEELAEAQRLVAEGADKPFLSVKCLGPGRVLAVGAYGLAFSTEDGGQHWQPVLGLLEGSEAQHLNAAQVMGSSVYLAGEQGALMRIGTDMRGFRRLASPYQGSFFALLATREQSLLAIGLRGHVFRSSDQGASWQAVAIPSSKSLTAASQLRDGSLLLADESGQGWLSRDDGRSFRVVSAQERFALIDLLALPDGGSLAVGSQGITRFPPSALR